MTKTYLMLDSFLNNLKIREVQYEILKLGIDIYDSKGRTRDGLIILKEIINELNMLIKQDYIMTYFIIISVFGLKHRHTFIELFLKDSWDKYNPYNDQKEKI